MPKIKNMLDDDSTDDNVEHGNKCIPQYKYK